MATLTLKISSLYAACSSELGVVSYGACRDEALNNLAFELKQLNRQTVEQQGREARAVSINLENDDEHR